MRYRPSRFSPLVAAATAGCGFVGQAFGAYTATNIVSVPFTSTDGTAAAIPTTYTTLQVSSLASGVLTDGAYTSPIVGVLNGATTASSSVSEQTAFAYDPTNGFRLIGDYTETSTGSHTNAVVRGVNDLGQVVGTTAANTTLSSSGGLLGTSVWLYSTAGNTEQFLPGLTGTNFSYTKTYATSTTPSYNTSGTYSASTPSFINDAGQVVGTTSRYTGDTQAVNNNFIGTSAWIYTPGSGTTQIGLTDTNHSYVSGTTSSGVDLNNSVNSLNANGQAAGVASNYFDKGTGAATSLGQDGWFYSGGTSTPIGMYYSGATPAGLTGYSYYGTPSSSTVVGTTPLSSQIRNTSIAGMNAAGQVIGTSSVYANGGSAASSTDAFKYTPTGSGTGTYQQLGFYSNSFTTGTTPAAGTTSFTNYITSSGRSTTPSFINSSGQVAGTSTLYISNGTTSVNSYANGPVAWVTDTAGANPTQVGLFGQAGDPLAAVHVNPIAASTSYNTYLNSSVTQLTNSGYVGGTSLRFSSTGASLGQDAWVYDPTKKVDLLVGPSDDNTTDYVSTTIAYLSENGYAVGEYEDPGTTSAPSYPGTYSAFIWSEAGGFVNLDGAVLPSLSASGYQNLINAYFEGGAGSTIYALASTNGSATGETQSGLVALSGSVPEPASISSILGLGAFGLLRRRRSAAK